MEGRRIGRSGKKKKGKIKLKKEKEKDSTQFFQINSNITQT
jgi:hypothetical protein